MLCVLLAACPCLSGKIKENHLFKSSNIDYGLNKAKVKWGAMPSGERRLNLQPSAIDAGGLNL
jgi:hypothetical protein